MMQNSPPVYARKSQRWSEAPLAQLLVTLAVGLLTPLVFVVLADPTSLNAPNTAVTLSFCALAIVLTWYALDRLRAFARVRQISYVMPVSFFTFGTVFVTVGLLRLPYSGSIALISAATAMAISYVFAARHRNQKVPLLIVPGGNVVELQAFVPDYQTVSIDEFKELGQAGTGNFTFVADLHHSHSPEWESLIAEAAINGLPVYHYRQVLEAQLGQVRISHLRENEFGSLIPNLGYMGLKRLIDIVGSLILLPIVGTMIILAAIAIKLDSPGPILFVQPRMGHRGRVFSMYKLRSMRPVEADPKSVDQAITRDADDRITRVGAFIRRYRIDELPQLINILKGDMSWIGPRPEAVSLSELYQGEIPFYRYRHIVRPGITGWAQVNQGHVASIEQVAEKLSFDFYYIRNLSLWLDTLICLKTLRIILSGFGAK